MSRSEAVREQKAKIILSRENAVQRIDMGLYIVQSQTGIGWYKIDCHTDEWVCNCPDFIKNGHIRPCKHILALKTYRDVGGNVDFLEKNPEPIKITYGQSWANYNLAQSHEIELFDHFLKQLVSTIEEPKHEGRGKPRMPLQDKIFCCVMKVYSQLSSRRSQCLYHQALQRQQISHSPHFNIVSKTLNKKKITPILHDLVHLSAQPLVSIETDFAIDSSGFRCSTFGRYHEEKYNVKKSRNWLKVHICTGVLTNIVSDVIITKEYAGDSPQFKKLIRNTAEHFAIGEVSADMAYSSRKNHEIVGQYGGVAYIPFKKNATGTAKGSPLWNRAYHYFQLHTEEFMEHYHKRSNVESTFSAIKKKFGETLKSRNWVAQKNEILCKIIAYNITVLIREMIDMGVDPEFFPIIGLTKELSMRETDSL